MTIEELLELITDSDKKEEAKTFLLSFETKINNLKAEIQKLEDDDNSQQLKDDLTKAIGKRDKLKSVIQEFRDKLGIPQDKEITSTVIDEYLADSSKGDKEKDARITSLRSEIEQLEETVRDFKAKADEKEQEVERIKTQTQFERDFNKHLPVFEPANDSSVARNEIEELLARDAVIEDGNVFYKKDGKHIRFEGEPVDIAMRLEQLKNDKEYMHLFKSKASSGSGSHNGGTGSSKWDQRRAKAGI